jgi:hypothetical protein
MKPFRLFVGLLVPGLCVWQSALGQVPMDAPRVFNLPGSSSLPGPGAFVAPPVWGTVPPPKPLPYGYCWNDYRGADIEHPLYAPRHAHAAAPAGAVPNFAANFCCWFDKLFRGHAGPKPTGCSVCQTGEVPLPPIPSPIPELPAPPLTSVAPEPEPPQPPATFSLPQPLPITPPSLSSTPPVEIFPTPTAEAPTPEADSQSSAGGTSPAPTTITETPPMPIEPEPASEFQTLPGRPPVVGLAPDFPIPLEPSGPQTAPLNVIPKVPQSVPRNAIPPQKRGNFTAP